jgi:hypothetical protein
VISTIMLNWIASGSARGSSGMAGRSRTDAADRADLDQVSPSAGCPTSGACRDSRASTSAFHRARGARRLLGAPQPDDARLRGAAVGFNPDAAAYGGINVKKNLIRAMAISGAFAGPRGRDRHARGTTNYQFGQLDSPFSQVGFRGIAVLSSGAIPPSAPCWARCSSGGLLFGTTHGLNSGGRQSSRAWRATSRTSSRDSSCSSSALDVLILYVWNTPRRLPSPAGEAGDLDSRSCPA